MNDMSEYAEQPFQPQMMPPMMGGMMPGYAPDGMSSEVVKLIIDDANVLEQVEHGLRNERPKFSKDENGMIVMEWVRPEGVKPLMTEEGISDTLQMVYSYCNPTNSTTDISAEKVDELVKNGIKALIQLYEMNWEKYQIDETKLTHIVQNIVKPRVYAGMRKGANGNTLKTLRSNWQLSEVRQNVQNNADMMMGQPKKRIGLFGL